MRVQASVAFRGMLAALCLLSATPAGAASERQLSDAEFFSAAAGKIVGAASACSTINSDRIMKAATQASAMASLMANSDAEVDSAQRLFTENDDYGRGVVRSGQTDCKAVEVSLVSLEKVENQ